MSPSQFPWRPLGQLLVDRGLLSPDALDRALAEQRRTGRLLGQVLVWGGYVSARALALALAEQHGVGVRGGVAGTTTPRRARHDASWRPLGRVLLDGGFLTKVELAHALAEKHRHPDRRLGEILVREGYVTGPELALALAEQHGVELDDLGEAAETVVEEAVPGAPVYRVRAATVVPAYRQGEVLFRSASFLEAADFACEHVQRERPEALEIEKLDGKLRETVWTYSEARATAQA